MYKKIIKFNDVKYEKAALSIAERGDEARKPNTIMHLDRVVLPW